MSLKEIEDGEDNQMVCQTHHKEEGNGRIISDAKDREGLREKLEVITDPMDPENHTVPGEIVNIVGGRLGTSAVNVSDALPLEKRCGTTPRRAGQMDSIGQFQRR